MPTAVLWRRYLLKPTLESIRLYVSFKRSVVSSRRFQLGLHWVTLHRLTARRRSPPLTPQDVAAQVEIESKV